MSALEHLQPIPADDVSLKNALEEAHIPSLICALLHITGDTDLIRGSIRPENSFFGDAQGNLSEEEQRHIRKQAYDVLRTYRDNGHTMPPAPDTEMVSEMVNFIIGSEVSSDYGEFLHAELMLGDEDAYAPPNLDHLSPEARQAFKVIIIGAGMSGLLAAIRLQQAGISFEIIERHDQVAGTWFQNTYPGCRVDSPNHIYSYSFKPTDWPQFYSRQEVLRRYFDECADEYDLKRHIRFNTEVSRMTYQDQNGHWQVEISGADGTSETLDANAVISAVGQLNRPKWPTIPGQDRFKGPSFHSTEWQHQHELSGKRVLVIGTGASAFQFAPEVAKTASQVTIFQRTPNWMAPVPQYHDDVPAGKHWCLNHIPYYAKWFRFSMFWGAAEGILDGVEKDPSWNQQDRSISAKNDEIRQLFTEWLEELCEDDQDLLAKVVPQFPPGSKRILFDNGNWIRALKRDNVDLITSDITEITETGVVTSDGKVYEGDILIYGTGFQASRFLWPMEVTGKDGLDLQTHWDGDPRAYLGITIPQFPNLFCMYGPNTNIVVNGSIVFFSECEARYIIDCIKLLLEGDHDALDCRTDIHDEFNKQIDAGNMNMAWGTANVPTWYKNDKGRVTQNWPFTLLEFWNRTRTANPDDYHFIG
jgi:4-hydroxyacetophenone monooxygenase